MTEASTTIPKTEAPTTIPKTEAQTTVPETEAPTTIPKTEAPTTTPETEAPTTIPETEAPTTIPETEAPTIIPETEAPTTIPETEAPTTVPETEAPTTIPETQAPTTIPETEAPTTIPETEAATTIPETEAPTTIPETEAPTTIPETEAATTAPETEAPTTTPETEAPTTVPETEAPTTITESTQITDEIVNTIETTQITEPPMTLFLLGFDGYSAKGVTITFSVYFVKVDGLSQIMYLFIKITYFLFRRLETNVEEQKVECHLQDNSINNEAKYDCLLNTKDKEIQNLEVSDLFEFSGKTVSLSGMSLMSYKYKNHLQEANTDYFSKKLYLLQDSFIKYNNTHFNISGNMNYSDFKYTDLFLQFALVSEKKNTEIKNASCTIIETKKREYTLECIPESSLIKGNFELPFSDLGDANLVVMLQNETNLIDMGNKDISLKYFNARRNKLSGGAIVAIVICSLIALVAIIILIYLFKANKIKNLPAEDSSVNKIAEFSIQNN